MISSKVILSETVFKNNKTVNENIFTGTSIRDYESFIEPWE